jgi:hypothetical protein
MSIELRLLVPFGVSIPMLLLRAGLKVSSNYSPETGRREGEEPYCL